MKKLALRLLILGGLVAGLVLALNYFYTNTNYWKYLNDVNKFTDVPANIQLANLGSSHGTASFDYTDLPYRAFNFALSAQRYPYDYAILSRYINSFDKDAVLIILVEYFEITRIKLDYSDQIARYYRFLPKEYMSDRSFTDFVRYNAVPILSAGLDVIHIVNDIDPEEQNKTRYSSAAEIELPDIADKKYESWTADTKSEFEAGEEGFAYNKHLISQIIELCYAHNIQPVLISTPITSILNSIYAERSPGFFDTFYRFTRELQESYPSIRYFDYSHDPLFANDFSLFYDSDHLNAIGAEKFTALVISDIQTSGLLSVDPAPGFRPD